MNGPGAVSFEFRYEIYLPIMGGLWDQNPGFFPHFGA